MFPYHFHEYHAVSTAEKFISDKLNRNLQQKLKILSRNDKNDSDKDTQKDQL